MAQYTVPISAVFDFLNVLGVPHEDVAEVRVTRNQVEVDAWTRDDSGTLLTSGDSILVQTRRIKIAKE